MNFRPCVTGRLLEYKLNRIGARTEPLHHWNLQTRAPGLSYAADSNDCLHLRCSHRWHLYVSGTLWSFKVIQGHRDWYQSTSWLKLGAVSWPQLLRSPPGYYWLDDWSVHLLPNCEHDILTTNELMWCTLTQVVGGATARNGHFLGSRGQTSSRSQKSLLERPQELSCIFNQTRQAHISVNAHCVTITQMQKVKGQDHIR